MGQEFEQSKTFARNEISARLIGAAIGGHFSIHLR
jgi:hypothetical protein